MCRFYTYTELLPAPYKWPSKNAWVWVARAKKNTPLSHVCFLLSWIYFILIFQFGMEGKVEGYVVGCVCVYVRVGNFEIMVLLLS